MWNISVLTNSSQELMAQTEATDETFIKSAGWVIFDKKTKVNDKTPLVK